VVIGDLGLSTEYNTMAPMSLVGTPHWMAPELYTEKYDQLVDIWSFGMCILELVTNRMPYEECRCFQALQHKVLTEKKKPDIISKIIDRHICKFIDVCLEFNPAMRPSADELLDHPFLLTRFNDNVQCSELIDLTGTKIKTKNEVANTGKEKKHSKQKTKKDVELKRITRCDKEYAKIKLKIHRLDADPIRVTFDFNHQQDLGPVAEAMINDLKIDTQYKEQIIYALQQAVTQLQSQPIGSADGESTITKSKSQIIHDTNTSQENRKMPFCSGHTGKIKTELSNNQHKNYEGRKQTEKKYNSIIVTTIIINYISTRNANIISNNDIISSTTNHTANYFIFITTNITSRKIFALIYNSKYKIIKN